MNIAIIDDNKEILNQLKSLVKKVFTNYKKIFLFATEEELKKELSKTQIDLLLLDIKLNDKNGIELVKNNQDLLKNSKIVYITGYDYDEDIFETNPFYYLKKPITEEKLEKVRKKLESENKNLVIKFGKAIKIIPFNEILYIDSYARIVNFHLTNNEILKTYNKLSIIEKTLPSNFIRIHKSYIINLDKVKIYRKYEVILENDLKLIISRSNAKKVEEKFLGYVKNVDILE